MKKLLVAINALLVLAIVGVVFYWNPLPDETPLSGRLAARPVGGDFTLDSPKGSVSLHDFAGKLVLLQFGYTYCPDICPTSLSILAQALGSLAPAELAKVQPIFVSTDPERDTVARLAEYTTFFHPAIIGLTGPTARLTEIAGRYGAVFVRQENASAGGYVIDHTALTYLIDRDGRLVASLPHATPPDQLVAEIRKYLPST
jgi:protein SCO1/2